VFPELLRLPFINFTLNTYGVMLAAAFIGGLALAARLASRDGYEGSKVYDIGLYMLLAVMVGSKVLMVVTEWSDFWQSPERLLSLEFWRSAGVFYGGFIGAVVSSFFLARHYQIPWWALADACAPGIALGQTLGRLGCFAAGCCWGKPTTAWCGVKFTERAHQLTGVPIDLHLHPTQLYESLTMLLVTFGLLLLYRYRRFSGQIILSYGLLYAVTRFVIEFYRDDPRGSLWIFSTSQLIAAVIGPVALGFWLYRWQQTRTTTALASSTISPQP
jgi:phosphatidylglycerol---prolipoprotein diacylglyceryl transferase